MILSQILYQKNNSKKSIVVLILGRKGNKLVAILEEAIDKRDASLIVNENQLLDNYPLQNKIFWAKRKIPEAYKKGYREFFIHKVQIQRSFSLTSREYIKNTI